MLVEIPLPGGQTPNRMLVYEGSGVSFGFKMAYPGILRVARRELWNAAGAPQMFSIAV